MRQIATVFPKQRTHVDGFTVDAGGFYQHDRAGQVTAVGSGWTCNDWVYTYRKSGNTQHWAGDWEYNPALAERLTPITDDE